MPSILRRRSWALPEVPLRRRLFLLAAAGLLPLALMSGLGLLLLAGFPFGSGQGQLADKARFTRPLQARRATVGCLRGGLRGDFGVPVRVPVLRDGEPRLVLTGVLMPQAIVDVIKRQRVPEDWL